MKSLITLTLLFFIAENITAQPTTARGAYENKDIEDMELGWTAIREYKPAQPFQKNGRTYTAAQIDFRQKLATWWQSSYKPTGLLGEMIVFLMAPDPALPSNHRSYDYNEAEKDNRKALPNTYGAYVKMHLNVAKTSTHKFWPMSGNMSFNTWSILANNVELLGRQMVALSSPQEYYFIQPRYSKGMRNFGSDFMEKYANYRNFLNSPNLEKYEHYFNPDARRYIVILSKDNKPLPFEHVTVGELIAQIEKRFQTMYTIASAFGNKYPETKLDVAKRGLQIIKEQMKDKYKEPVYVSHTTTFDYVWLSNIDAKSNIEYFIKTKATYEGATDNIPEYFPLLRLKKGVKEACAGSTPQWIVCAMNVPVETSYGGSSHAMDEYVSRFNYDYLYQYVFGETKPAGPYRSVGSRE